MRWIYLLLMCFAVVACSSKKSSQLHGFWLVQAPYGAMNVEFKEDGSYSGQFLGLDPSIKAAGKYEVDGSTLHMDAPAITGGGSGPLPKGRPLDIKMTWLSYNSIEADAGGEKFMMHRTGTEPK